MLTGGYFSPVESKGHVSQRSIVLVSLIVFKITLNSLHMHNGELSIYRKDATNAVVCPGHSLLFDRQLFGSAGQAKTTAGCCS